VRGRVFQIGNGESVESAVVPRLPVEDFHTMAGFVFGLLGRAPVPGDEVDYDGVHLTVAEVEGTRIERLEIQFRPVLEAREPSGGVLDA